MDFTRYPKTGTTLRRFRLSEETPGSHLLQDRAHTHTFQTPGSLLVTSTIQPPRNSRCRFNYTSRLANPVTPYEQSAYKTFIPHPYTLSSQHISLNHNRNLSSPINPECAAPPLTSTPFTQSHSPDSTQPSTNQSLHQYVSLLSPVIL